MKRIDWNEERYKTRDRLIDYSLTPYPITTSTVILPRIYPWENIELGILSKQIFKIAQEYGYTGNEDALWERFQTGSIITGTLNTFPIPGDETTLYLDTETDILYYFKTITDELDFNLIKHTGAVIIKISTIPETGESIKYLYIPIHALGIVG